MAIKIVDLPIKNSDSPSFFVRLPGRVPQKRVTIFLLTVYHKALGHKKKSPEFTEPEMVGWPTEKWWSESQLGWLFHSQYDGKVIKHVPNHQPVIFSLTFFSRDGMGISNLGIQEKLVTLHDQLGWFQVIPKTICRASCWSRWISSSSMGLSQANSPALGKNCAASMTPKMASMTTRKFGGPILVGGHVLWPGERD